MSDKKLPQPGEWWQYNGVRVRIVGTMLNGHLVCEYRDGKTATLIQGDWWQHLPDCTGWDWVPEVYPKWFIPTWIDASVAYFRVDNAKGHGAVVYKDGTENAFHGWNNETEDATERTEAEAKSQLNPPVPKCPDCGEPVNAGHEHVCPMAWVTQDLVAARPGIDERAYKFNDISSTSGWADAANTDWPEMPRHGTVKGIATVLLRCRRKDLPVPVPEPAINPGEGYRLIDTAIDVPMDGDEMWLFAEEKWAPRSLSGPFVNRYTYRRRITPAKPKIPLRAWVSNSIIDSHGGFALWLSQNYMSDMTEVHGLNIYIENPSASGSGDAAAEA